MTAGVVVVGFLLMICRPAEPAWPVFETGAQLVQSTITATNSAIQTAKWILELTGLPEFVLDSAEYVEDLQTLAKLVREGQALLFDIASLKRQLETLFALDSAPMTSVEYVQRMGEIRVIIWESQSYAMRVQTLICTILNTIKHAIGFIRHVAAAVGGLQAEQTLVESTTKMTQQLAHLEIQTAAANRVDMLEGMSDTLIEQSLRNINQQVWGKEP